MKALKKSKGFTLVELIVVIAIIGILAAVLIPSISGYVVKARQSAALQEAQPVLTAYTTYIVDLEAENIPEETPFVEYAVSLLNLENNVLKAELDDDDDIVGYSFTALNLYVVKLKIQGNNLLVDGEPTKG